MSNDLVSQQLPIRSIQMSQHLEHISDNLNPSNQMGFGSGASLHDSAMQQVSIPSIQMGMVGLGSSNAALQQTSVSAGYGATVASNIKHETKQIDPFSYNMASGNFLMPDKKPSGMGSLLQDMEPQQLATSNKRKAPMGAALSENPVPQRYTAPKRFTLNEHRPWLQPTMPLTNRPPGQMQSTTYTPSSQQLQGPPRKTAPVKTGAQSTTSVQRSQPGQMKPPPKVKSESFDSVRSKLRESLAAALALVHDKSLGGGKDSKSEAAGSSSEPPSNADGTSLSSEPSGSLPENGNVHNTKQEADLVQNSQTGMQEQQPGNTVSIEDIPFSENFFVKDDLLQGNGLSWVLDSEMELIDESGIGQKSPDQDSAPKQVQNPEILASKIEAELFKLFGGVNKKYKEKGRSLLFNLKDRNNPELRERVMCGEITPERLCSMTAEELASKELSEWRMAKAEELAQMVVLPDSDVDIRKLVRKTHKGEFQVEVEHDRDVVSAEVAVGTSFFSQPTRQAKSKEKESSPPSKGEKTKDQEKNRECQGASYTLTIPSTEGSDFMQGLMVDDELKDVAFLPPIVSLDEFMESLDAEPPFGSVPEDAGKATTPDKDDDPQVGSETKSPLATPKDPAGSSSDKARNDVEIVRSDAAEESSKDDNGKSEAASPPAADAVIKGGRVWEGSVQLNVSVTVSFVGIFKSGEKAPSKDWPSFIEIKGRVRLEAFEKFLQELPMSRSRAVMAVHFVCKEGSTESEKANVVEVAESYVGDERVGIGEPAPGVELYLCPPNPRICGLLSKVLPQDQVEALDLIDNGLIGVVVWRKPQIISPRHKHSTKDSSSKKLQHSSSKNRNPKHHSALPPPPPPPLHSRPPPVVVDNDNDDDDVPPGFGPPSLAAGRSSRDEDDLPEFNFNNAANRPPGFAAGRSFQSSNSPRGPVVDQMRELVHRYGQPSVGSPLKNWTDNRVPVQTWKDEDDDDDMPEWRPDDAHGLRHHQPAVVRGSNMVQQSVPQVINPIVHQHTGALPPPPPPPGWPPQQQQGGGWAVQAVDPHGVYHQQQQQQPNGGGQFYGGQQWSRDAPKSRGF